MCPLLSLVTMAMLPTEVENDILVFLVFFITDGSKDCSVLNSIPVLQFKIIRETCDSQRTLEKVNHDQFGEF